MPLVRDQKLIAKLRDKLIRLRFNELKMVSRDSGLSVDFLYRFRRGERQTMAENNAEALRLALGMGPGGDTRVYSVHVKKSTEPQAKEKAMILMDDTVPSHIEISHEEMLGLIARREIAKQGVPALLEAVIREVNAANEVAPNVMIRGLLHAAIETLTDIAAASRRLVSLEATDGSSRESTSKDEE